MFLGHSQQPADYRDRPIFLRESSRPTVSLRKHTGVPVFSLESHRSVPPVQQKRQEPTLSLQEHPEFLRLLNDERFRQELRAKPVKVLARFGVQLRSGEMPHSIELPLVQAVGGLEVVWTGLF